jgi:predicted nucleic-acid-binding Zn-ribbon protein
MVNFFHLFFDIYVIIDQKLLMMNFKNLIAQTCRKCQYAHHSFSEKSQKSCNIALARNLMA